MKRRHRITALKFTENTVSFRMDGEPVWDRVQVSKRVPMVGHYDLHKPVVRVDRKITDPKERHSLAVHEAAERHLRRRGIPVHQAHLEAETVEHQFARQNGIRWPRYSQDVEKVFRQNRREGVRRRR
jgi:hypothetical protein